jgi:MATE family multidrug resistance protein
MKIIFDNQILGRLSSISLPLVGGMVGGLIMMLVDRTALSYYSEETLIASGPAVFTAMTVISFFTGYASVTRSFVGQEAGSGHGEMERLCLACVMFALTLGVVLLMLQNPITLIPQLSNREPEIKELESAYLYLSCYFGFFMVINIGFSSFFGGQGKTKILFFVGMIGLVVDIIFTLLLVFGWMGFPEWGMEGSAVGTLIAVVLMTIVYSYLARKELLIAVNSLQGNYSYYQRILGNFFRIGFPLGMSASSEEFANTAFVWIVGLISMVAIAANNLNLIINYVSIIPIIGLAIGCSILIAQEVGSDSYDKVVSIFHHTIWIELVYVVLCSIFICIFARDLIELLTSNVLDDHILDLAVYTVYVVWTYGVAFVFSMTGSTALEAVGHTKIVFWVRIILMWLMSVPINYYIASQSYWGDYTLLVCWLVGSVFELLIGLIFISWFHLVVRNKDSRIGLVPALLST